MIMKPFLGTGVEFVRSLILTVPFFPLLKMVANVLHSLSMGPSSRSERFSVHYLLHIRGAVLEHYPADPVPVLEFQDVYQFRGDGRPSPGAPDGQCGLLYALDVIGVDLHINGMILSVYNYGGVINVFWKCYNIDGIDLSIHLFPNY